MTGLQVFALCWIAGMVIWLAVWAVQPWKWRMSQRHPPARPEPSEEARCIAQLFALEPEAWICDVYVAHHRFANISVWIANEEYGIGLWSGPPNAHGQRVKPENQSDKALVWSAFVAWRRAEASVLPAARARLRLISAARPNVIPLRAGDSA
jgi:hypothetical protein